MNYKLFFNFLFLIGVGSPSFVHALQGPDQIRRQLNNPDAFVVAAALNQFIRPVVVRSIEQLTRTVCILGEERAVNLVEFKLLRGVVNSPLNGNDFLDAINDRLYKLNAYTDLLRVRLDAIIAAQKKIII